MKDWEIGLIVAVLIAVIYYLAVYRPKHKKAKSGYMNGYGWHYSDWMPGAGAASGISGGCGAVSADQACEYECAYFPQGESHLDCMHACKRELKISPAGLDCRRGSCRGA